MQCPHCGAAEQSADAYCRRCGEWVNRRGERGDGPEGRMNAMITFNIISAVFALVSVISLFATYLGKPEAQWSIYVAGAMCIVIAVHQSISFAFALELKLRLTRGRRGERRKGLAVPDVPVRALPRVNTAEIVDMPSVTEGTTDLLPSRSETRRGLTTGPLRTP
jgi:hypothetical protein